MIPDPEGIVGGDAHCVLSPVLGTGRGFRTHRWLSRPRFQVTAFLGVSVTGSYSLFWGEFKRHPRSEEGCRKGAVASRLGTISIFAPKLFMETGLE